MSKIHTHPGQPEMQVEVILASGGPSGPPIYTLRLRYPRIIHAEVMTHRKFSRNARSSRAVPVERMIDEVRTSPFVPWHWSRNQKGMQGYDYITVGEGAEARAVWYQAVMDAVRHAEKLADPQGLSLHKQIVNRLLEPFMWIDTLITSTDLENFLWLRDHKDTEPHLQDLARLVKDALDGCEVKQLAPEKWHLPYITEKDRDYACFDAVFDAKTPDFWSFLCKISAARCARISYAPFDGDASYTRELERYDSLVKSDRIHASPLEHQATPDGQASFSAGVYKPDGPNWLNPHLHGNLRGWVQFRKTIPNESAKEGY